MSVQIHIVYVAYIYNFRYTYVYPAPILFCVIHVDLYMRTYIYTYIYICTYICIYGEPRRSLGTPHGLFRIAAKARLKYQQIANLRVLFLGTRVHGWTWELVQALL